MLDPRKMNDAHLIYHLGQYRRESMLSSGTVFADENLQPDPPAPEIVPARLAQLTEEALRRGLLVKSEKLHEVWILQESSGDFLMPTHGCGFSTKGFAVVYFLGFGSPQNALISFVVNPHIEADTAFTQIQAEADANEAARGEVALRVIDGEGGGTSED